MAVNEAAVLGAELEAVDPTVPVLFEQDDTFYAEIEKRPKTVVSARDMRVPLKIRPGGRFGHFDPDGGNLGRGDGPTYDKATLGVVHLRHAVEITKKAEWATNDKRKAVVNVFRKLLAEEMDEFRQHIDRLCQQSGDGVVATISTVATSGGKDLLTLNATGDGFFTRLLRYGNYYGVFDSGLTTKRTWTGGTALSGEGQIDLYDPANKQVRMNVTAGSASAIATDKLVVSGLSVTPVSLFGVPYHHNNSTSGSWLGFTRSSTPEVIANAVNASSAGLAVQHARLAINKIGARLGVKKRFKLEAWMHPCQVDAYERLGQMVHQITRPSGSNDPGLSLYFDDENMQLAGAKVRKSFNWNMTRIDFVAKELWGRAEMNPPGFYENDGKRIFEARSSDGGVATAGIFYITASFNLYHLNPAGASYIYGLAIPSGY